MSMLPMLISVHTPGYKNSKLMNKPGVRNKSPTPQDPYYNHIRHDFHCLFLPVSCCSYYFLHQSITTFFGSTQASCTAV